MAGSIWHWLAPSNSGLPLADGIHQIVATTAVNNPGAESELSPATPIEIGSAYVDYLKRCRAEGLSYLQPGRFLAGTTLEQLFFPLSRARGVCGGTNGAVLARRYEAYRKLVRRFMVGRQLVRS